MCDYDALGKRFCDNLDTPSKLLSSDERCPICLNTFFDRAHSGLRGAIETSCQHIFHYDCLHTWLATGNPSCPLCRELLYTRPTSPIPVPVNGDALDDNDSFDDTQALLLWAETAYGQLYESTPSAAFGTWFEENHVLRSLENNWRNQRQRLSLMEDLSALPQEDGEPAHAEIQYSPLVQGDENDAADWYRQERLGYSRLQHDLFTPSFLALDNSIWELIVEERNLRHEAQLEQFFRTNLHEY
jgi:hypothetical protein